jgi:hypothetical protein
MDADEKLRKQQGARLVQARRSAGYTSARSAALDNGWTESTYRTHEGGTRTIGQDDAEKYAKRFRARGARTVTGQWILFGGDNNLLASAAPSIPVELVQMALELVLRRLAGMSNSGAQELAALVLEELQAPEPLGAGLDIAERRGALDYIIRRSGRKSDA